MNLVPRSLAALALSALFLTPVTVGLPIVGTAPAFAKGGGGNGGGNGGGSQASQKSDKSTSSKSASAGGKTQSRSTVKRKAAAEDVELASVEGEPSPKNAHGLLASELKGLNAVHANPNAFENANPNSQVGRIALYREAALAGKDAAAAVETATAALGDAQLALGGAEAALSAYDAAYAGRSVTAIDTDIAALDPAAVDYQAQLDALNVERDAALAQEAGRLPLLGDVDLAMTGVADAETSLAEAETAAAGAAGAEQDALLVASNGRVLSDEAIAYIREQLGL